MKNNIARSIKSPLFTLGFILFTTGCANQSLLKITLPNIEQYRFAMPEIQIGEKIFNKKNRDDDNDGIYNPVDKCPHTQPRTIINWLGCPRNSHQSNPLYLISEQ